MANRDNPYRVVNRHNGETQMRFRALASARQWLALCDHEESDFRPSDARIERWDGKGWHPIDLQTIETMTPAQLYALGIASLLG